MAVHTKEEISYTAKIYRYPDGSEDLICAADPIFRPAGWEIADHWEVSRLLDRTPRKSGAKSEGSDMLRSMRRARAQLRRLALANEFDYFVTLTLDAQRIDRYDGAAVVKGLSRWCNDMVKRHGLRYILVPELHKDGAFHFHGFMAGDGLQIVDSGVKWDGKPVYNLPQWRYGFTTAQRLYGEYSAAVGYCCKYIGKQQGQRPLGRWYYSGGPLARPEVDFQNLDIRDVDGWEVNIPGVTTMKIQNGVKSTEND